MRPPNQPLTERQALREQLLAERERFALSAQAETASAALTARLAKTLSDLAPQCLGVYWPIHSEFNAAKAWNNDPAHAGMSLALPFAQRTPHQMHYRIWDGTAPAVRDECNIPSSNGAAVVPDIVLVPCLGYTESGFRLGYGAGYFDRWMAAHPEVTAIGVAWSLSLVEESQWVVQAHDRPLMLIVTECGIVG